MKRHSRGGGNPERYWLPDQARHDVNAYSATTTMPCPAISRRDSNIKHLNLFFSLVFVNISLETSDEIMIDRHISFC
jgi:hypothetical protein